MPAKAGIHGSGNAVAGMDSRFRGNDELGVASMPRRYRNHEKAVFPLICQKVHSSVVARRSR